MDHKNSISFKRAKQMLNADAHGVRIYAEISHTEWNDPQIVSIPTMYYFHKYIESGDYMIYDIWIGSNTVPVGRV